MSPGKRFTKVSEFLSRSKKILENVKGADTDESFIALGLFQAYKDGYKHGYNRALNDDETGELVKNRLERKNSFKVWIKGFFSNAKI